MALGVASAPSAIRVRIGLEDGVASFQKARRHFLAGDVDLAHASFRAARSSFEEARQAAASRPLRLVSAIPVLGRNVDVIGGLTAAGALSSQAGAEVSGALAEMPDGLDALMPNDGRIPLERLQDVAAVVEAAADLTSTALSELRDAPTAVLLPPLGRARRLAEEMLTPVASSVRAGARLLGELPRFLGSEAPRRYFFGAENPAELRGTGGLIGAFSLLKIDDGRLSFSGFQPIQRLPRLKVHEVEPPNDDYGRLYDPHRHGNGFWLNVNMTPDFPTAAQAIERAYEIATGQRIDGVITADPFAFQSLLTVTGPVYSTRLDKEVTAATVVPFVANEAYAEFDLGADRKRVLGSVAESVLTRFLTQRADTDAFAALVDAVDDGHVKVYTDEPAMQAALVRTGAAGRFDVPHDGDLLSVVQNNGAASKIDFYLERSVQYSVQLLPGGHGRATARVSLANMAPERDTYGVQGPNVDFPADPGDNFSIVNIYCGRCALTSARRDGERFYPGAQTEAGSTFYQDFVRIARGDRLELDMSYDLERVWRRTSTEAVYRFTFLNQTTIRGTELSVEIRVPPGSEVVRATEGAEIHGDVVTWSGVSDRESEVEVAFSSS